MRRLLALLTLTASAVLALVPPADAGGPTSVLITDPSTGRATALYYTDAAYVELDSMLGGGATLQTRPTHLGERVVNLTWMLHDREPWRRQQLYLDAAGGPVVGEGSELLGGAPGTVTWTRPADAPALQRLVDRVLQGDGSARTASDAAPRPPEQVVVERVRTETTWVSLTGWRWLVPGLLAGAAGALVLTRLRDRRGARSDEQRRLLVDVAP